MKKYFYTLLLAILACSNLFASDSTRAKAPRSFLKDFISEHVKKDGKVKLDLYVMSFCPYGINAEKALIPIIQAMGDSVDFHLFFIAEEAPGKSFQSLHGPAEVLEDRRQLIIARHFPGQLPDYLLDRTLNYAKEDWTKSAQAVCLDVDTINTLLAKNEEADAFRNNIATGNSKMIFASPSLFINGELYNGPFATTPRRPFETDKCQGGANEGGDCLNRDDFRCPNACKGGGDPPKTPCTHPDDCHNACEGGPHAGHICTGDIVCEGKCVGGRDAGSPCDTKTLLCRNECVGGINAQHACSDDGECPGGTCSIGHCDGTCTKKGECTDIGRCLPVITTICCFHECMTNVSHSDCDHSAGPDHWREAGTCPESCENAAKANLSSLNAVYIEDSKSVQVSWRMAATIDNPDFYVERSRNGEKFNNIGYIDKSAMVDSSFNFSDITPFQVGYYRLSFTIKGRPFYSQTVTVIGVNSGKLVLMPNPAIGSVRILLTNMQLYNTAISITDLSGRLITNRNLSNGQFEMDVSNLPTGVFIVRAQQNGKIFTGKLVKN